MNERHNEAHLVWCPGGRGLSCGYISAPSTPARADPLTQARKTARPAPPSAKWHQRDFHLEHQHREALKNHTVQSSALTIPAFSSTAYHHSIHSEWSCDHPPPMPNNNERRVGGGQGQHARRLPSGPAAWEDGGRFEAHRNKLNWDSCVHGRQITHCWLTRWQSLPGVVEIVLWRTSNRPASSHICKLPQTRLRRCAPAPGTRSHSETAWKPGPLVSARETDAGADTTRSSRQQEHTSQSQASSQTAARAAESPDKAVVPIKMLAFCWWKSLTDIPAAELAACHFGKTTQCEEAEEDDNKRIVAPWVGEHFHHPPQMRSGCVLTWNVKCFFFFNQTKMQYLKCYRWPTPVLQYSQFFLNE